MVHWPLTGGLLHLVQRGGAWAGCGPAQAPPRCTKCNSPPINGQCSNHCMMVRCSAVLMWRLKDKALNHAKSRRVFLRSAQRPDRHCSIIRQSRCLYVTYIDEDVRMPGCGLQRAAQAATRLSSSPSSSHRPPAAAAG